MSQPCPRCANAAPDGARFCPACGSRIGSGEPARFASPGVYTPPHLAQRILDSREALEGERKQVTVLFADIHGMIEAVGDRDPEEIGPVIDRVRELMMEAVHRYEGTVNQVMGDGIMALFGAPLANEDHAVRACSGSAGRWASAARARSKNNTLSQLAMRARVRPPAWRQ
jgi:class 3 adenylate cyclase